jgi:hypothetical protein
MGLKRKPVREQRGPEYPSTNEYAMDRRAFIGMLGLAAAGLGVGCGDDSAPPVTGGSKPGGNLKGGVRTAGVPAAPQAAPCGEAVAPTTGGAAKPEATPEGRNVSENIGTPAQPQSTAIGRSPAATKGGAATPRATPPGGPPAPIALPRSRTAGKPVAPKKP